MTSKLLIVLGSPRKKGNSATLAAEVARSAAAEGANVETVYLNGLDIRPCQGCGKCQQETYKGCTAKDDMQPLYAKLAAADSVVLASPVYWFNISAQTKIFIDRLYAVGVGSKNIFKGKHFAFLLAYADPDPFASGAVNALRSFQDTCRYLDAHIAGMVYGSADGAGEIVQDSEAMQKAGRLGRHLASLRFQPA